MVPLFLRKQAKNRGSSDRSVTSLPQRPIQSGCPPRKRHGSRIHLYIYAPNFPRTRSSASCASEYSVRFVQSASFSYAPVTCHPSRISLRHPVRSESSHRRTAARPSVCVTFYVIHHSLLALYAMTCTVTFLQNRSPASFSGINNRATNHLLHRSSPQLSRNGSFFRKSQRLLSTTPKITAAAPAICARRIGSCRILQEKNSPNTGIRLSAPAAAAALTPRRP